LKVNEWTANGSENNFFCPYIEESSNDEQATEEKEKVEGTDHDTFCGIQEMMTTGAKFWAVASSVLKASCTCIKHHGNSDYKNVMKTQFHF